MVKRAKIETDDADDEFEELASAISIDPNALDEALVRQPDMFYRVSSALAMEISLRDAAKDELKVIEAQIDEVIRAEAAEDPDKKKPAEAEITRLIAQDGEVRKQNKVLSRHNKRVGMLSAIKESYLQRSYALKELVSLYLANYYGDASERSQSARAVKDAQYDKNRADMHEERQRRSRTRTPRED